MPAWLRPGGLILLCLLLAFGLALAAPAEDAGELLRRADGVKTANHEEFTAILASLDARGAQLSLSQRLFLRYLHAWQSVYDGDYDTAIPELRSIITETQDTTLHFRAGATLVNVLAFAAQYQEAFLRLSELVEVLPLISDRAAREQGLGVAALLYNRVGEYDLALALAQSLIEENWNGRGACNGGQLRLEALFESGRLRTLTPEFAAGVDACLALGEHVRANAIRAYMARLMIAQRRYDDAIMFLKQHYAEVQQSRSPRVMAEFDALLAQAYRYRGYSALARQFALKAIEGGVKNQYTEPLVAALRLLYEIERERGNLEAALVFNERYSAADKGYLDDVSARQLAYERAKHEAAANKLQISGLHRQNEVLQLQQALDRKAVETSRLYIALLTMTIVFVALWAYRTKRSQLHFMRLSRLDGLTGIANRPHFIELAERSLEHSRRLEQEVCIVLCDLDHFKAINDRYGHATGDFVLKQTVLACNAHLRPIDLFGRFGGEEFGFLLPGCSLADARQCCERLRAAIAAVATDPGSMVPHVSASFGVASSGSSGYELRQLLAHADAALYRAKHAGRNCVVLYDGLHAIPAAAAGDSQHRYRGVERA